MNDKKTLLITGGTQGIGKALALHFLHQGQTVVVIGSSQKKGNDLMREANNPNLVFIQADLSLIKENERVTKEIKERFGNLDILVFCAQSQTMTNVYKQTAEGLEYVFALYYLSRYVLSYGLKELLGKSENPIILNVCGTGTRMGNINWGDLQQIGNYKSINAIGQGNRLHELAAVSFDQHNQTKVKYILYNPGIVRTEGATEAFSNFLMRTIIKIIAQPINKAMEPIITLLNSLPQNSLSAYKQSKELNLTGTAFNIENAQRLQDITDKLIKEHHVSSK